MQVDHTIAHTQEVRQLVEVGHADDHARVGLRQAYHVANHDSPLADGAELEELGPLAVALDGLGLVGQRADGFLRQVLKFDAGRAAPVDAGPHEPAVDFRHVHEAVTVVVEHALGVAELGHLPALLTECHDLAAARHGRANVGHRQAGVGQFLEARTDEAGQLGAQGQIRAGGFSRLPCNLIHQVDGILAGENLRLGIIQRGALLGLHRVALALVAYLEQPARRRRVAAGLAEAVPPFLQVLARRVVRCRARPLVPQIKRGHAAVELVVQRHADFQPGVVVLVIDIGHQAPGLDQFDTNRRLIGHERVVDRRRGHAPGLGLAARHAHQPGLGGHGLEYLQGFFDLGLGDDGQVAGPHGIEAAEEIHPLVGLARVRVDMVGHELLAFA